MLVEYLDRKNYKRKIEDLDEKTIVDMIVNQKFSELHNFAYAIRFESVSDDAQTVLENLQANTGTKLCIRNCDKFYVPYTIYDRQEYGKSKKQMEQWIADTKCQEVKKERYFNRRMGECFTIYRVAVWHYEIITEENQKKLDEHYAKVERPKILKGLKAQKKKLQEEKKEIPKRLKEITEEIQNIDEEIKEMQAEIANAM